MKGTACIVQIKKVSAKNRTSSATHRQIMDRRRRFRQDYFITNQESMIWFLIIIEIDEHDFPIQSFFIRLPETDPRFKIYPYIKN